MTDPVLADYGIRQLHARYADAVWRQDAESFAACFAIDGVWKIAGMEMAGRAAIGEACGALLGRCERIRLITGQPILEVGDGTATGRLQMTELTQMRDGTSAMTLGTYHDRYVDQDGAWRFARRHWTLAYRGPVDLGAAFVASPDYGPFPAGPAEDAPTIVRQG